MMPLGWNASAAGANFCSILDCNSEIDTSRKIVEQTLIWGTLILDPTFSLMVVTEPVRPHGSVVQTRPGYSGRARNGDAS